MPFVPSSFLLLVVRPGATSSVLAARIILGESVITWQLLPRKRGDERRQGHLLLSGYVFAETGPGDCTCELIVVESRD